VTLGENAICASLPSRLAMRVICDAFLSFCTDDRNFLFLRYIPSSDFQGMTVASSSIGAFLRFIDEHGSTVRIADRDELIRKITTIKQSGISNFQIVSDFDRTLTPQWLKDPCAETGARRTCHASHGVIESSPLVSEEYRRITHEFAEYYIPLEHDHSLPTEKRREYVSEWYEKAHDVMVDEKLTITSLETIVKDCWGNFNIHLRENSKALLDLAADHKIPVTVLSAGIRDVIEMILVFEGILSNLSDWRDSESEHPVMVVSNRMIFDEGGRHTGFVDPVIHALTKKEALHDFLMQSKQRSSRANALVMGDLIADVDFVHSIPHLGEYIAVGFLCDQVAAHVSQDYNERIKDYLEHFDIVILGGTASMDIPTELIKTLCS
jgi:cytosolic 5'-nucleotidase 3